MLIYDLVCVNQHGFEGWFANAEAFTQQHASGLLCCPFCDSHHVERVPSKVAIHTHSSSANAPAASPHSSSSSSSSSALPVTGNKNPPAARSSDQHQPQDPNQPLPMPMSAQAQRQQMLQLLLSVSENVGDRFAEEARRMYYDAGEQRPIYGQVTADELNELTDEGINVLTLPIVPADKLN